MDYSAFVSRVGVYATAFVLALFMVACDSDDDPVSDDPAEEFEVENPEGEQIVIETRGDLEFIIGVWRPDTGWTDEDGNEIESLAGPIEADGGELEPLTVGGQNASLTVRVFDENGEDIEIGTDDRPEFETLFAGASSVRTCESTMGDVGAQFDIVSGQDLVSWPPISHPDDDQLGTEQFAFGKDGSYPAIFHCDHIQFYPEQAGLFEVSFSTTDGSIESDPINVEIEDTDAISRAEIETRGQFGPTIAVWTPEDGWTDEDGTSIDTLEDPIEQDDGTRRPLVEGDDANASLTVRFFDADGSEYDIETLVREDIPTSEPGADRERECSAVESRFAVLGDTDVISWPSQAHPDGFGAHHFAQWAAQGGDWVANFHCDHTHFYPETAGSVDVEFALYDNGLGRSIAYTDPITVEVVDELP